MKKLIAIMLLFALVLSCCACQKQEAQSQSGELDVYADIDETVMQDGVYKIHSIRGIENMAAHPEASFEVIRDIDLGGAVLSPIGTKENPFTGSVNGNNFVIFVHYHLLAENINAVSERDSEFIHGFIEIQRIFKIFKKTHKMNILRRGKLHACDGYNSVCLCRFEKSRAVAAGVVVCESHYIELCNHSHAGNVVRSHIVITAG